MINIKLNTLVLDSIAWNHLTVCKQMSSGLLKTLPTNFSFTNQMRLICMYKLNLALNNLQGLIYCKTQPISVLVV